jgi:TIR domain
MPPPEIFFSYAHTDEPLLLELRKHLAALERAQLIQSWFDRRIEPGSEWAAEIQAAMERATIILLLISSDFIASNYCATVEMPFALQRQKAGALVIPIVLRPVLWQDLPVSALQALPTGAKPVTTWPNSDEAFRDIAEHLREMILTRRLKEAPKSPAVTDSASSDRVLDAAVPKTVELGEPSQLVTMIRRVESAGLKAILEVSTSFAARPEDVKSKTFEVDFPVDAAGKVLPAALELVLESPGCDPPKNSKKLRVPPTGDSDVCVFLFVPKKIGKLNFNLEVRYQDVEMGSQFLVSEAAWAGVMGAAPSTYSLATLPLTSTTFVYAERKMARADGAPAEAIDIRKKMLEMVQSPRLGSSFSLSAQTRGTPTGGVVAAGEVAMIALRAAPSRFTKLAIGLAVFFVSFAVFAIFGHRSEHPNLTGTWQVNYADPVGRVRIRIHQTGQTVVANMVDGNGYLPAGAQVLAGTFGSNPFNAQQTCAYEGFKNPSKVTVKMNVVDKDHLAEDLVSGSCRGFPATWVRVKE